ncbi:MAG TPA: hypothetical protein VNO54_06670 [Streptosporangiaceae bacterium]|nr:hypothetical protein [Streptosporangiaceae bacterium]
MSRAPSANEVLATVARLARIPLDDLDGYVIVLASGAEVSGVLTNAADESTVISLLARAIEHRSVAVKELEASHESCP